MQREGGIRSGRYGKRKDVELLCFIHIVRKLQYMNKGDLAMRKQLLVACVLILCIVISICIISCGNNNMSSYIGNTYEGVNPWGNELVISVNDYDDSSVRIKVEEALSSNLKAKSEYEGSIINDNTLILNNSGEIAENNERIQYEYSRKLEFVNGEIAVTYIDGKSVYESAEGNNIVHRVDALSEDRKTIKLKLK